MEFKNIYLFYLGLFGFVVWALGYWKVFQKSFIYIPAKYTVRKNPLARFLFFLMGAVAWLLISYAMSGPRMPIGNVKSAIDVNDIFFVVDTSGSMEAEDLKPNRLGAAKKKILEFIELRPTDRIGIVIFGNEAFTLLPLTQDLSLIEQIIGEIKLGLVGGGTNIGDAIGLAVARGAQSLADNKVIILLTDGASNVGSMSPVEAAQKAKSSNMKIYTIGIGTKNAKIPRQGFFGKTYIPIRGGGFDPEALKKLAAITGGKAFVAKNEEALKKVLEEIDKLERTEVEVSSQVIYRELYLKYLLAGVLLLLSVEFFRRMIIREAV